MQRYYGIVHACLLGCVAIHADSGKNPNNQAPISLEAWKDALPLTSDAHDVLILQDGTRIYARINQLPPIQYSFSTVCLPVDEISMASFYQQDGVIKAQYITRDGLNYAGAIPQNYLLFYQISSKKEQFAPQDLKKINVILFHARTPINEKRLKNVKDRVAHLELKNGDQIPFISSGECLSLRSEGKYHECVMGDIVEAIMEGKPHLVIKTSKGIEEYTDFTIREPHFSFYLPNTNEVVLVPWSNISRIYQEQFTPQIVATIPSASTPKDPRLDNEIAFAGEGLMVFLHPVESPISLFPDKDSAGITIS